MHRLWFLLRDERGQGMAEYALLLSLVALVCVGATRTFGTKVDNALNTTSNTLP